MTKQTSASTWSIKKVVLWAASFALIASLVLFILEKTGVTNFYKKSLSTTTQQSATSGPTNVIDYPIPTNNNGNNLQEDKQSGTDKPVVSDTLSGTINYKAVTDDKLSIRVTIYQPLDTGTCVLTLVRTSDGKRISNTTQVVENPSSSTCNGFDIPVSELGPGTWNITTTITSGSKTGTITGEVSI